MLFKIQFDADTYTPNALGIFGPDSQPIAVSFNFAFILQFSTKLSLAILNIIADVTSSLFKLTVTFFNIAFSK